MAVAAFYAWQRAGRPVTPARPIRDIVERMKAAYPTAASTFGWYADEAHYTAVPAEDHTPYSQTGWPAPSPQWWVFATDIMHRPDLGVDCNVLFAYWIAEARAGRMPWLKYLNWQGKQYRAKGYGGETVAFRTAWTNSGHYDHIHFSTRTDHRDTSLGSWSLIPGGDDMSQQDIDEIKARLGNIEVALGHLPWVAYRFEALAQGLDKVGDGPGKGETMWTVVTLKALLAKGGVELTPAQLATLAASAHDGAKAGVDLAAIAKAVNDDDHRRSES